MARRKKPELAASGETFLSGPAVFEPLPPYDGSEKTSVPLGTAVYAKSGGLGPFSEGSPLLSTEESVLWQARVLRSAIEAARVDGYVVQMPFRIEDLDRIVISATAKATPTT